MCKLTINRIYRVLTIPFITLLITACANSNTPPPSPINVTNERPPEQSSQSQDGKESHTEVKNVQTSTEVQILPLDSISPTIWGNHILKHIPWEDILRLRRFKFFHEVLNQEACCQALAPVFQQMAKFTTKFGMVKPIPETLLPFLKIYYGVINIPPSVEIGGSSDSNGNTSAQMLPLSKLSTHLSNVKKLRFDVERLTLKSIQESLKHLSTDSLSFSSQVSTLQMHIHDSSVFQEKQKYDEVTKCLVGTLKNMPNLQKLHLHDSRLGTTRARIVELAEALPSMTKLQLIDLGKNKIDDEGIQILAQALTNLNNLQRLNLSNNRIESEGIKEFAKSLPSMTNLQILELQGNIIEQGEKDRISSMKKNSLTIFW